MRGLEGGLGAGRGRPRAPRVLKAAFPGYSPAVLPPPPAMGALQPPRRLVWPFPEGLRRARRWHPRCTAAGTALRPRVGSPVTPPRHKAFPSGLCPLSQGSAPSCRADAGCVAGNVLALRVARPPSTQTCRESQENSAKIQTGFWNLVPGLSSISVRGDCEGHQPPTGSLRLQGLVIGRGTGGVPPGGNHQCLRLEGAGGTGKCCRNHEPNGGKRLIWEQ